MLLIIIDQQPLLLLRLDWNMIATVMMFPAMTLISRLILHL